MVSNKKRLYVALDPSGISNNDERKYHWSFLVGPKSESQEQVPGTHYHAKNRPLEGWIYEENPIPNVRNTNRLLVRIQIAKVLDEARLARILRGGPIVQNDPNWRCRTWIATAIPAIEVDGKAVGTAVLDWQRIETTARRYASEKVAAGRYETAEGIEKPKPTWDMLENRETVP